MSLALRTDLFSREEMVAPERDTKLWYAELHQERKMQQMALDREVQVRLEDLEARIEMLEGKEKDAPAPDSFVIDAKPAEPTEEPAEVQ
jgi:hypothetical protein